MRAPKVMVLYTLRGLKVHDLDEGELKSHALHFPHEKEAQ